MNYKIDITSKAQNDLEEIFRYIAFNLQSFINASNLLDRFEQAIYSLEQLPERFRLYDKEPWKNKICVLCLLIITWCFTLQTMLNI